ncbi:hypothetical protein [Priestia megaterium]|uniref:hypothetical protein n=1 Tax=Priestia megaterium TaxID=1404 RepID=UPI0012D944D9|nr:hypothetical protein [Priestia megaterium]MUL33946.1 hypothetical protein [Priestia megaterium]
MIVQVLKGYRNRTEYKVLEKFVTVQEINIDNLSKGILLFPGILLGKLEEKDLKKINQWLSIPSNQLILTPAWRELNLKDFFNISVDLKVLKSEDLDYKEIECQYKIEGKIQEKLFVSDKGNFCIHYRKDTGSGLLTVITLPLLDYKLSHMHEKFEQLLLESIEKKKQKETKMKMKKEIAKIGENHLQLFMLIAAGFKLEKDLRAGLDTYFNKNLQVSIIHELESDLIEEEFIENKEISDKGKDLIIKKRLKSFIKVLERGRKNGEW